MVQTVSTVEAATAAKVAVLPQAREPAETVAKAASALMHSKAVRPAPEALVALAATVVTQ